MSGFESVGEDGELDPIDDSVADSIGSQFDAGEIAGLLGPQIDMAKMATGLLGPQIDMAKLLGPQIDMAKMATGLLGPQIDMEAYAEHRKFPDFRVII